MTLRLSGEEFSVLRGLDGLGWVREVDASADGDPGLKITPGTGPGVSIEKNNAIALRQLKAGGGYADLWKLNASDRIQAGADLDFSSFQLFNAVLGSVLDLNSQQLSDFKWAVSPDGTSEFLGMHSGNATNSGARVFLFSAGHTTRPGEIELGSADAPRTGIIERLTLNAGANQGLAGIKVFENLKMQTVGGKYQSIEVPSKAGVLADADFNDAQDGLLALDSTNNRVYFRIGGAWKYAALT